MLQLFSFGYICLSFLSWRRNEKKLACEHAPKWGIELREKSSSKRGGKKERERAREHSFDAAVRPPCN